MPTWLITGCSTGLGRHLAKAVLQRGMNAVVTSRDVSQVQDIVADHKDAALALSLDVTNPQQVKDAVSEAARRFGAIDVLVNNAGYGYRAAVEEADEGDVDQLFATNFFGTVRMIKTVLPGMRARRSGTIINVSSIAGRRAMPGSAYYAASKFAIGGMSDGLRKEMAPLGIRVMVIEPGAFRTDFSGRSLQQSATRIADYDDTAGRRRKENDTSHGRQPGDPARAAKIIIDVVEGVDLPSRLLLGPDAVKIARDELDFQMAELEAWRRFAVATDFPSDR
jgi:NAD(P)-dependent dehydrogenase (short-subunit alcohol dehydrogenase family)